MKKLILTLFLGLPAAAQADALYPDWAYAVPTPQNEATAPQDDGTSFTLPGGSGAFTRSQISGAGRKAPADWYPSDHPPMPPLVAAGDPAVEGSTVIVHPNTYHPDVGYMVLGDTIVVRADGHESLGALSRDLLPMAQ